MESAELEVVLESGTVIVLGKIPAVCDSVLVILFHERKLVLVGNPKRGLEMTGGHTEQGESVAETAIREAKEESGATIRGLREIGYYRLPDGHVTTVVTAEVEEFEDLDPLFETEEVHLVSELPEEKLSFRDGLYAVFLSHLNWPA